MELLKGKYVFTEVFASEYAKVVLVEGQRTLICEAIQDYIPIEDFKHVFNSMAPIVKEHHIEKFIFDKRKLRIFHQPSMEWYFIVWKKEMLALGLKTHRKLLPTGLPWFEQAVQAGRKQITKDHPNNVIDKLDIQYRDDIESAIIS